VFGCDSISPTPRSAIAGGKDLVEVEVRRDYSVLVGMPAKLGYEGVQQADWLHPVVDDVPRVRWAK
jgi:hypothetical protein